MTEVNSKDQLYAHDPNAIDNVRQKKAWMSDALHFKRVKISPSASIKMMSHCQSGVDKGIKNNGNPVEVMGLLVGHPDSEDPHAFIISDAQALPIEGFETSVVADDQEVINYQIALGEANELTRKDLFCGWYHSHPFDLDGTNHCYLSKTDVTTQTLWQNQEDRNGNPWLAIVVDPLLSIARSTPEIRAFRVYPAGYTPPKNQTPDGEIVSDPKIALERWGACWDNYYMLEVSYFMSQLAQNTLNSFRDKFMWMNALASNQNTDTQRKKTLEMLATAENEAKAFCHDTGNEFSPRKIRGMKLESLHPKDMNSGSKVAIDHCQTAVTNISKCVAFGGVTLTSDDNVSKESSQKMDI